MTDAIQKARRERIIDQKTLTEALHYDPDTGVFRWRKRRGPAGYTVPGNIAGHYAKSGYVVIKIDRQSYSAHRLAWQYVTGKRPIHMIDHIDGNGHNNAFSNLREATCMQNQHNARTSAQNTSGFKGVSYSKAARKWVASIRIDKKPKHLGLYSTPQEAHKAYAQAALKYRGDYARMA